MNCPSYERQSISPIVNTVLIKTHSCYSLSVPFVGEQRAQFLASHFSCQNSSSLKEIRKRQASKFSRRRKTLLRKAHELYVDCNVDIYLVVRSRRSNQVWQYTNGYAPPTEQDMVRGASKTYISQLTELGGNIPCAY